MNANRVEKQDLVAEIKEMISPAATVIIMHYQGLTVEDMTKLRKKVREAGAGFKIAKNTLTKVALKGTKYEKLSEFLTGPTAISYSKDPVSAAKVVVNFSKENEKLKILGGAFDDKTLDIAAIKDLAAMLSLDESRAKIIALLQTPGTRVARVISEKSKKVEEAAPAAAAPVAAAPAPAATTEQPAPAATPEEKPAQ